MTLSTSSELRVFLDNGDAIPEIEVLPNDAENNYWVHITIAKQQITIFGTRQQVPQCLTALLTSTAQALVPQDEEGEDVKGTPEEDS